MVDIAGVELALQQHVVGGFVVDGHLGRVPCRDRGRQWVVVDVDELEGVLGAVTVGGDDGGDGFAGEADLVPGQDRLRGLDVGRQRRQRPQADVRNSGDAPVNTASAASPDASGVAAGDLRVPVGAAQEGHMPHAWQFDVRDVVASPGDQSQVLLAGDGASFAPVGASCSVAPSGAHGIAYPPLTERIWPVVHDDRSEARSRIVGVTSSGVPKRRSG